MTKPTLSSDDRGQVYILEAILGVTLLLTVTFIIAPSIATVSYEHQVNDATQYERITSKVDNIFDKHAANGNLKTAILQFADNEPDTDWHPRFYFQPQHNNVPPDNDVSWIVQLDHTNSTLAQDLQRLQRKHNIVINAYIITNQPGHTQPQRIPWIVQSHPGNTIGTASTTITLYKTDRLRSPQRAHTHLGSPVGPDAGTGEMLRNVTADDGYPIMQSPNVSSTSPVYNTVTIRILIFKEAKAL